MKKLADYQGEEAFELWADLLDPVGDIMSDPHIKEIITSGSNRMKIATDILKTYKKQAEAILLRIDPEPINGLNILLRLISLITELGENEDVAGFFGFAEQVKMEKEPSGSAMVTTEANVK